MTLAFSIVEIEAARKGVEVERALSPAFLKACLADAVIDCGADLERCQATLKARLSAQADNVHVRGRLRGALTLKCQRCLEDAIAPVDAELHLTYVPKNSRLSALADPFHGHGHHKAAHGPATKADKSPPPKKAPARGKAAQELEAPAITIDPLDPDDVDYAHHDRETVDLSGIVREYLLLSIPITVLCREDCRGLCPSCGVDLNKTQCACDQDVPLSPFAALKKIDLNRS